MPALVSPSKPLLIFWRASTKNSAAVLGSSLNLINLYFQVSKLKLLSLAHQLESGCILPNALQELL